MARTLSPTLATVVEELELDQPVVVTAQQLDEILRDHRIRTSTKVVAARLRDTGWLLPTGRRGVWEFAPGSHAGPVGHGDPLLPLRAALAQAPSVQASLSLGTAAWAHGHADRVPTRIDVAVPAGTRCGTTLDRSTAVRGFSAHLPPTPVRGVPCHRIETVVVHLAARPGDARSWDAVLEWLPDLAHDLSGADLEAELTGRPRSIAVRTGYLLSGMRPDLAAPPSPRWATRVHFGPRDRQPLRHSRAWNLVDHILPSDPATWEDVR